MDNTITITVDAKEIARELWQIIKQERADNEQQIGRGQTIKGVANICKVLEISRSTFYLAKQKGLLDNVLYTMAGTKNLYFGYLNELKRKKEELLTRYRHNKTKSKNVRQCLCFRLYPFLILVFRIRRRETLTGAGLSGRRVIGLTSAH